MIRHNNRNSANLQVLRFPSRAVLASLALLSFAALTHAQGLVYVDAVDQSYGAPLTNLFKPDGSSLTGTELDPNLNTDGDNIWGWRSFGVPDPTNSFSTIYESSTEDAPEIRMTLSSLTASTNYDVYVVYWADRTANWNIRAGFTSNPGANQVFDRNGDAANSAIAGTYAASGAWTTPPANDIDAASDDDPSPFIDHTPGAEVQFTRDMYLGLIGSQVSTAGGQINVYLDDLPGVSVNDRSWIEGLAYVPAGTSVFATASIDRDTGNLTINNPTAADFTVASISLTSEAGTLNGTMWNNITDGTLAGMTDTDNDWVITSGTSASETELAEQDEGFLPIPPEDPQTGAQNGVVFANTTGVMNLGDIWRRTPYEDVQVALTLVSGDVVTISPSFTGTEITPGDFTGPSGTPDGNIDVDDYIALIGGLHADFTTTALAYAEGDIDGDGDVDRNDVVIFRSAYDTANGAGAFAGMVARLAVPEPCTAALSLMACGGLLLVARRRNHSRRVRTQRFSNMIYLRKLTPWLIVLSTGLIAGGLLVSRAAAVAVINWEKDPLLSGPAGATITDPGTNHPTIGNGGTDSADNVSIFGSTPSPVSLLNGEQVVLSGQVHFTGATVGSGNGSFRWGLFKDTNTGDANPTTEWLGYLAHSAGANPADGQFYAKNPDASDWTTASFISTFGIAPYSGPYTGGQGRVFQLASGAGNTATNFANDDDTYAFQITVGRYGDEVTVSATMQSQDAGPPVGDYNENGTVDAADYTTWRDALELGTVMDLPNRDPANTGLVSEDDFISWRDNFGATGGGPTYQYALGGGIDFNGNPPPAPVELGGNAEAPFYTDHLTFDFDRVGFLFADHLNADQVALTDVDVSAEDIQSVTLEVNTTTGASRILNDSSKNFNMIYYEITSTSESLIPGNWTSLDDAEGGDPVGVEWDEAGGSDAGVLSEVNLLGTPKSLAASGSTTLWSLGDIWNTSGEQDLRFFFTQSNGALVRGIVQYVGAGAGSGAAVPEPATAWLLCLGMMSAAVANRRSRRRLSVR